MIYQEDLESMSADDVIKLFREQEKYAKFTDWWNSHKKREEE
jgi:hypothetical protein